MCKLCFDVLIDNLLNHHSIQHQPLSSTNLLDSHLPPDIKCPLFVTWEIQQHRGPNSIEDYNLRGCIGTLSPRTLRSAVGEYALTSAFKDHRFNPVRLQEVELLRVAVSLLVEYEKCSNCYDWVVGVHGIIIKFHDGQTLRSATYLPEVASEQGWDCQEGVASLIRKSGYQGTISEELLRNIETTRYQSSKRRLTYAEYVDFLRFDPLKLHPVVKDATNSKKRDWRSLFHL